MGHTWTKGLGTDLFTIIKAVYWIVCLFGKQLHGQI